MITSLRMPTISTKTGDNGETGLVGGKRVSKASTRIHAYGTVDELNAVIGLILSEEIIAKELAEQFQAIQKQLFVIGADLATPAQNNTTTVPRISAEDVHRLEQWGNQLEQVLPAMKHFILPSGSRAGALLHLARTVCRRAERWVVDLSAKEEVNPALIKYLNRLSDYFFLASRTVNKSADVKEVEWIAGEF